MVNSLNEKKNSNPESISFSIFLKIGKLLTMIHFSVLRKKEMMLQATSLHSHKVLVMAKTDDSLLAIVDEELHWRNG